MPSEMMNPRGFSPSFFHEEVCFSDERQGVRKMDHMAGYPGLKSDGTLRAEGAASSPLENRIPVDSQREKGFGLPEYYLNRGRNVNLSFIGAERAASHSLPNAVDHDLGAIASLNMESASYFVDGDKINLIENGLFSSSLSDLFSRNLKLSSNNAAYGHSVGAADEEEAFESLEELEAQTIGNLLPDDDDLLSGVTDGFDRPNNGEDMEDLDLFSSVGGMELGEEISNNRLGLSGGSNPSRTLFVRNINSNVEDSELQTLFEQYGDIHTLYTACKHRGFVMISYYDVRAACNAMKALQNKPLRRRKLDIHFSIPKENPSEKDINQGTLVVFNLDSSVSNDKLREIFGVYGEIKEIHESPHGCHQKYIEFYDVRAAESALRALNMSEIAGKQIILEAGLPGGFKRLTQPFPLELEQEEPGLHFHHQSSPNNLASGFSGSLSFGGSVKWTDNRSTNGGPIDPLLDNVFHPSSVPNSLPSLVRVEKGNQSSIMESGHLWNQLKFDIQGAQNVHPHSLPEYHDGLANGHPFGSPTGIAANISSRAPEMIDSQQFRRVNSSGQSIGNGSGRHYMWNNSHHHPLQNLWPNSPQFNGMGHMMNNALVPINNNHHVGSAPSVNPSLWDRRHEFHPGSLGGNMRISGNLEFVHHNIFPPSGMDMPIPSKTIGLQQRCMMFPTMMSSLDSPSERTRNRRSEGISSQGGDSKRQFELDVDRILRGEDKRTTLMIKNIPNKYTSKMLLAAIDERHRGTYDFIYLPIDFKNKCNVGYAFINMTDPSLIVPFYETFNGKKWEKFNSEKVASLAYGRIQGKSALIAHFQNSSLMNEDKRCRPILFHTDGPNAGDQVPFPMGSNIRARPGKSRADQEMLPPSAEDYLNGDLSSSGSD